MNRSNKQQISEKRKTVSATQKDKKESKRRKNSICQLELVVRVVSGTRIWRQTGETALTGATSNKSAKKERQYLPHRNTKRKAKEERTVFVN